MASVFQGPPSSPRSQACRTCFCMCPHEGNAYHISSPANARPSLDVDSTATASPCPPRKPSRMHPTPVLPLHLVGPSSSFAIYSPLCPSPQTELLKGRGSSYSALTPTPGLVPTRAQARKRRRESRPCAFASLLGNVEAPGRAGSLALEALGLGASAPVLPSNQGLSQ